jgi:hypothetical protein
LLPKSAFVLTKLAPHKPTYNAAFSGVINLDRTGTLKIQISKPDKARAKNCAAAYDLYARSNFLQVTQYGNEVG